MKHFDITVLADFARGVGSLEGREAVRGHLQICRKCERVANLLARVASVAVRIRAEEVPSAAVHCAEAIFALREPKESRLLPRLLARLVFDSFREPLPVGVRSGQRLSRQVLFEAGDYRVDLRLERDRGSSQVSLVGQLENRKLPKQGIGSVPVMLAAGKEVIARTLSNPFGEFQFDCHPGPKLQLFVVVPQEKGRRIEVPLHKLLSERRLGTGSASRRLRSGSK